jgi:hypothetical protein
MPLVSSRRERESHSDNGNFRRYLRRPQSCKMSERSLFALQYLATSKLNTRVRFPSPAPIVSVTYTASDTYFRQNRLNTSDKVFLVCSQRSCRTAFLNLDEYQIQVLKSRFAIRFSCALSCARPEPRCHRHPFPFVEQLFKQVIDERGVETSDAAHAKALAFLKHIVGNHADAGLVHAALTGA